MILHFIFVVKEEDRQQRQFEFEYVKKMAQFYKVWIKEKFGRDYEIQCDELITQPRSILQRLDTHTLVRDHYQRGKDTYHFYLTHFKPLWTDCTCEGYHAENFGLVFGKNLNRKMIHFSLLKKIVLLFLMKYYMNNYEFLNTKNSSKWYMTFGQSICLNN